MIRKSGCLFFSVPLIFSSFSVFSEEQKNTAVEENVPMTVEGERFDLGGRGRILDNVVVTKENNTYSIEISFSQFMRSVWYTPKGSGNSVTIKLEPALTSRVDRDALSDRAIITPDREDGFPVREVMYEGVFRSTFNDRGNDPRQLPEFGRNIDEGPFLVIRFDRNYAIEVVQDSGFRSITINIK